MCLLSVVCYWQPYYLKSQYDGATGLVQLVACLYKEWQLSRMCNGNLSVFFLVCLLFDNFFVNIIIMDLMIITSYILFLMPTKKFWMFRYKTIRQLMLRHQPSEICSLKTKVGLTIKKIIKLVNLYVRCCWFSHNKFLQKPRQHCCKILLWSSHFECLLNES